MAYRFRHLQETKGDTESIRVSYTSKVKASFKFRREIAPVIRQLIRKRIDRLVGVQGGKSIPSEYLNNSVPPEATIINSIRRYSNIRTLRFHLVYKVEGDIPFENMVNLKKLEDYVLGSCIEKD